MLKPHPIEVPLRELKELLDYDPETGKLLWAKDMKRHKRKGRIAGSEERGYRVISVNAKKYKAHRLAWYLYYLEDPYPYGIDHVDGNGLNNSIDNLRLDTERQNNQNRKRNKTKIHDLPIGVRPSDNGRYVASIWADGRSHSLGGYATIEEASAAYIAAKRELHPFGTM